MTQSYNPNSYQQPLPPTEDRNTFQGSIKYCLSNYANFNGRASRSEYWYFCLFTAIVGFVAEIFAGIVGAIAGELIALVIQLGISLSLTLPSLAVGARRLHDTGRSGAYLLLGLIPLIGGIILIVFFCQESQPHENQYGPNPYGQNLFG